MGSEGLGEGVSAGWWKFGEGRLRCGAGVSFGYWSHPVGAAGGLE